MTDSDTDGGMFDPAALLQMDMEDTGPEFSAGMDLGDAFVVDMGAESDTASASDQQTPTKNNDVTKLKSFEDEKQFIALMELANGVSMEEMDARSKYFDLMKTSGRNLLSRVFSHCTICDAHVPIIVNSATYIGHPILKILVCQKCYEFYGDGNFDRGEDGVDLYCRWCAEGGKLFCCSTCPNVFCRKCIKTNFGPQEVKNINDSDNWSCYVCEPKLLWGFRGIFATVSLILAESKGSVVFPEADKKKDLSYCCTYRTDLRQYLKSQSKMMSTYCEGVVIPTIKGKVLIAPTPPRKPINAIERPALQQNGAVNDFFANGHFLEPALPAMSMAPQPPPVAPRTIMIRPRLPGFRPPLDQARNPQQLTIRPRNLNNMLQNSLANSPRGMSPGAPRRHQPAILQQNRPRFMVRNPQQARMNMPGSQIRRMASPAVPNVNPTRGPPALMSANNKSGPPPLTPTNNKNSGDVFSPTQQWFHNILDQALMSADFYKDEIMKLKLNSMTLLSRTNVNMRMDTQVLSTVKSLNWVMKSMLEQGLDIRRTISKVYPKMDSQAETVNMARLHKAKGVPLSTFANSPGSSLSLTPVVKTRGPATSPRTLNNYSNNKCREIVAVNGKSDVVDLVSDDEDDNRLAVVPRKGLTITSVQSINKRLSIPSTRSPLTPTPANNRLSLPAIQNKSPARRRKRRKQSDDSEEDQDYIPKANPSVMKRRRKTNGGFINKPAATTKNSQQMVVTDIRSLQNDSVEEPDASVPSSTLSYLNQVSEDVMEKVLQLDSGQESSDVEEVDQSGRDPLDEDDKDDWITQNPTAYEKYCVQHNLVKDWYIAVKILDTSSLAS